jgi:hypothetical protein
MIKNLLKFNGCDRAVSCCEIDLTTNISGIKTTIESIAEFKSLGSVKECNAALGIFSDEFELSANGR